MDQEKKYFGFGKNVFFTGLVSFFMDVSSEMIYPLVPLFLANVLGVNKSMIGLIEGIAESTASLLKVFSGWLSDRIGQRKNLMFAGYAISTLSRPIIALAGAWQQVLASRFVDRLGKGIRTAPRDAIIAESTETTHLAPRLQLPPFHGHHGGGGRPGHCPHVAPALQQQLQDGLLALHDTGHHCRSDYHCVHQGKEKVAVAVCGAPPTSPSSISTGR